MNGKLGFSLSLLLEQHFLAVAVSVSQLLGQSLLLFQFHSNEASPGHFQHPFLLGLSSSWDESGSGIANLGYFTILGALLSPV